MASTGQVVELMAEVSGFLPSTLDRMLRNLRAAGLAPEGEKGRSRNPSGQYEPQHLAAAIFAFAGDQPSDAAFAASHLAPMRYWASERKGEDDAAILAISLTSTLGDAVEKMIRDAAPWVEEWRPQTSVPRNVVPGLPHALSLSLTSPSSAQIHWLPAPDRIERKDLYLPFGSQSQPIGKGVVGRKTFLDSALLFAAAELWADTLTRRGELPAPSSGNTSGGGENENASDLAGSEASSRNNQPRAHTTGHSHIPEYSGEGGIFQSPPRARGRLSTPTTPGRESPPHAHADR